MERVYDTKAVDGLIEALESEDVKSRLSEKRRADEVERRKAEDERTRYQNWSVLAASAVHEFLSTAISDQNLTRLVAAYGKPLDLISGEQCGGSGVMYSIGPDEGLYETMWKQPSSRIPVQVDISRAVHTYIGYLPHKPKIAELKSAMNAELSSSIERYVNEAHKEIDSLHKVEE